ncbi:unnamed protein product [Rotaria sp. Silwood1]|nr:unnamed protein product [Rotaria sp. Silwood1]CAF4087519.1 unnamed protein product [Rotaria sp. Silwood1]CAF5056439.1 unnamed protein product [Rotaria sp. Silwood1]
MSIDNQLSKMYYCRICSNKEYHAIQLIEPLVDLIRDPLTMCPRISSVPSNLYLTREFALHSKRFLLFASSSPFHIDSPLTTTMTSFALWLYTSGSQKTLIDIDSSYFKSRNGNIAEIGITWCYDYFKEKSIRFDRIIAYEYQKLGSRRV